jgi:palmitoyltransferase
VLGNNPLLWLWPSRKTALGDGLIFPVEPHIDPQTQHLWPPRDPDDLRPSIFSSKYKRQQEKRQLWKQQQRQHDQEREPMMIHDDVDDSEDYYDSGSFITDSDDEYSLMDEEENAQSMTSSHASEDLKSMRQTQWEHAPPSQHYSQLNTNQHYATSIQHRSSPSQSYTPQLLHHPDDSSDDDKPDYDDTIPLYSFLSRPTPSSSKDSKAD